MRRFTKLAAASLLNGLIFVGLLVNNVNAQPTQCQILAAVVSIETGIDELVPENLANSLDVNNQINRNAARAIKNTILNLMSATAGLMYARDVTGNEDWVLLFLNSRYEIINSFLARNPTQTFRLRKSRSYSKLSVELETLKSAANCANNNQSEGDLAFERQNVGSLSQAGNVRLPRQITQLQSAPKSEIFKNTSTILPLISLGSLAVLLWAWSRYDSYTRNVAKRYYSDVVFDVSCDAKRYQCTMIDISRSGAGFELNEGEMIKGEIIISRGDWSQKAQVIWSGEHRIGVKFKRTLKYVPDEFHLGRGREQVKKKSVQKMRK